MDKCILAAIWGDDRPGGEVEASLQELARLVTTAGGEVVGEIVQHRRVPDARTYLGKGKAKEVKELALALGATTLVVDANLRPAQEAALAKITGLEVLERTRVILEIFARHAFSAEGKLQVQVAELQYRLGRLTGRGTGLSRLGGGRRTRGPGEQQLEEDRRRIRRQMRRLSKELDRLDKTRQSNRKLRNKAGIPVVALVGYTNAGKSTLLKRLTGVDVAIEDKLFSTLDPHTGRMYLPSLGREVIVIDTVGFVRDLPPQLIEAFKATLDEVLSADLVVHVVDASSPEAVSQVAVVRKVLEEIGASEIPEVLAINKCDLIGVDADLAVERLLRDTHTPDAVPHIKLSAAEGKGVDALKESIARFMVQSRSASGKDVTDPVLGKDQEPVVVA